MRNIYSLISDLTFWYLVYTVQTRELLVKFNLFNAGFETYLPITLNQYNKTEVLFSRYVFVKAGDDLAKLYGIKGVLGVVCSTDGPAIIPDDIIEALKARENNGIILTRDSPKQGPKFKPGDAISIKLEPYSGFTAIFDKQTGKNRASVLIQTFGHTTRLALPMAAIAPQGEQMPAAEFVPHDVIKSRGNSRFARNLYACTAF